MATQTQKFAFISVSFMALSMIVFGSGIMIFTTSTIVSKCQMIDAKAVPVKNDMYVPTFVIELDDPEYIWSFVDNANYTSFVCQEPTLKECLPITEWPANNPDQIICNKTFAEEMIEKTNTTFNDLCLVYYNNFEPTYISSMYQVANVFKRPVTWVTLGMVLVSFQLSLAAFVFAMKSYQAKYDYQVVPAYRASLRPILGNWSDSESE